LLSSAISLCPDDTWAIAIDDSGFNAARILLNVGWKIPASWAGRV
jgi:hypothetical protein